MAQKIKQIYEGKAKLIHSCDLEDRFIMEFKDDTSAFDGEKTSQISEKGYVNNHFNHFIMSKIQEDLGIPTQVDTLIDDRHSVVKKLDMFPVECVVRNITAGSICRRLGVEEKQALNPSTYELFLKNDELHDPLINEDLAISFNWADAQSLATMKKYTLQINEYLRDLFDKADLLLVDFKLEYGLCNGEVTLGDEFTPDGCRLWDKHTLKKLDKDRFRHDLGDVVEAYKEVAYRIGVPLKS